MAAKALTYHRFIAGAAASSLRLPSDAQALAFFAKVRGSNPRPEPRQQLEPLRGSCLVDTRTSLHPYSMIR